MTALLCRVLLSGALSLSIAGCAVQKQYSIKTGSPRLAGVTQSVSSQSPQPKIQLQLAASGALEARFEAAPVCHIKETWAFPSERMEERSLSKFDSALMWTGYGLSALVGGFVGVGIANGGDPVTGSKLFALFGLPFATVGAVQSVRAADRSYPLAATDTTYDRGLQPCAVDAEGLPVRLRRGADEKTVYLTMNFTTLGLPAEGYRYEIVAPVEDTNVRASVPLQVQGTALFAVLDGPIAMRAVEKAPEPAMPSAPKAIVEVAPITMPEAAPALTPQLEAKPAVDSDVVSREACTRTSTQYGVAPSTFYEQEVRTYRVRKGDWLSKVAQRLWGDVAEYRQLHLLNGKRIDNPDVVHAGEEIAVPVAPKAWSEWQRGAEACAEK